MKLFKTPKKTLGDLDADTAASVIAAAADVALIVDSKGVIRDMAFGSDELSIEGHADWLGRPWADTVTVESRPKIETMLREAASSTPTRWRQVNHASAHGQQVPILYSTVAVGPRGRIVALGRDLRSVAALQQRLVEAQQSLERDYARLRHAETRYRLLFQLASEAVLIVDEANQNVVEANPAAVTLFGDGSRHVVGRRFPDGFDAEGTKAIDRMLGALRAAGRAEDVRVRLAAGGSQFIASASLFRQDKAAFFLVRLSGLGTEPAAASGAGVRARLLEVVESLPDGFVTTGTDGNVLGCNRAFLDLAQLATEEQARGESLERWLGRPGVDLGVLLSNLRQHGSVRLFATTLRGEYGSSTEVEISAVSVPDSTPPCIGFSIRNVGRRLPTEARSAKELPRSVEQLTELIGRVSLKDLVRETTDTIERLCIEAALELTGDNRASAAEMLGLSRQSLYVKLRRYGLGDLDGDAED